ncbi:MAG: ABC transporter permease subunit [Theionarchaea archaeon]|nr:ABC transporter permease subunit [Theionarchaea archaeon]MBU7021382.1 ABC transporter permease subunit [Theionarchaea archaeon]
MVGNVILMEFKSGWKGFFIFAFLILLISAGMPQLFPSYRDSLITELEGAQNVSLTVPEEGEITLAWKPVEGASYLVLQDTRSSMVTAQPIYRGEETRITLPGNGGEDRYYAVMAVVDDTEILVGIATTAEMKDPLEDYMNNPIYAGFTGGRHMNLLEAKGFIVVEFFSFWWILAGLFIAYVSVSTITGDFEGKRMDLIFSTPISRERYILEKFTAMSVMSLVIILVAATGLISSIAAMELSSEFDSKTAISALIGCLPLLMTLAAFGMLTAVIFQKTRVGIGVAFAFVIGGFLLNTFGGYSESLEWMKSLSIMNYWDYYSVIFDSVFKMGDFVGLFIAAFMLIGLTILIFRKKDIPT